jgi:hypothetical protein
MAPPTKRNRSRFHLSSLGYASAPRARYPRTQPTHWAWNPPREPAFKSRGTVSKEPAIKPAMATGWEILIPVQSPRPKPVNASPAEARLRGVSRKSVNAWQAPFDDV